MNLYFINNNSSSQQIAGEKMISGFKQTEEMFRSNKWNDIGEFGRCEIHRHVLTLCEIFPRAMSRRSYSRTIFKASCLPVLHQSTPRRQSTSAMTRPVARFPKRRTTELDSKRRNTLEYFPLFCVCMACICSIGSKAEARKSVRRVKREWVVAAGG